MPFVPNPPGTPRYTPPCMHHEHNPPTHVVLPPGYHTWCCPACGKKVTFFVDHVSCKQADDTPGWYDEKTAWQRPCISCCVVSQ